MCLTTSLSSEVVRTRLLISSRLISKAYKVTFDKGGCNILCEGEKIAWAYYSNGLYRLDNQFKGKCMHKQEHS